MAKSINYHKYIVSKSDKKMFDNFAFFLYAIWKFLRLPAPTWLQRDISEYLEDGPRRRIIQAFRGCGKSWITAAYVLWLLYRDPQHRIMVVSASGPRADAFSIFCKRLIDEVPFLSFLQPRDGQRTSNIAFDVGPSEPDQSPSVKSVGITGQLTGSRADTIVADDIEIPKNSYTELQREKLAELVKEFDAVLKPGGEVIYLGTPQVAQSLYSEENLQSRGYECRVWPSRFTHGLNEQGGDVYHGTLAPKIKKLLEENPEYEGHTTEPERFSDLDLAEREGSYGRSGFALQFMLDTSLNDANRYPLKIADFIVMDTNPDIAPVQLTWASGPTQVIDGLDNVGLNGDRYHAPLYISQDWLNYTGSTLHIDPSGRGSDETAYAVTKFLNGFIYITRWGGLPGGYDDVTLDALVEIAKAEKVNEVIVESNFGDGMYTKLILPHFARKYPVTITENSVSGQKERRIIDVLEPALNQHRLVLNKQIIAKDIDPDGDGSTESELMRLRRSGLYQLTHITAERDSLKKDDRVDILAQAVQYWIDFMEKDTTKAEKQHREKQLDEALKSFTATYKGKNNKRRKVYKSDGSVVYGSNQ
jgi:hypothetical protein